MRARLFVAVASRQVGSERYRRGLTEDAGSGILLLLERSIKFQRWSNRISRAALRRSSMSSSTSRVMEYDPFSQEFQADPFPVYRWMRDEAPGFYSEKGNWWALSRFEDVRAAETDPQTFL